MAGALTKAGRYQIVSELGRGSMGVVYQGFDPIIGRTVAIKTMLIETLASAEFEEYKARFQREAQSAGALAHPNIVTVYDFGEDSGVLYLAMEYLEGKSLQKIVEEQNILPIETIIPIYEQVCGALDVAHAHKIVHRDIKPANIMILESGLVKVTDFGIAKMMSMGMTQAGQILGTPNYMSPEQVKGRPVDGRSDIFSLGVILYELVTGEKPFGGQNITTVIYKIINENPIPPRELDATIHPGLSYVISKALAKSPDERYQTCRELAEDLRNYKNLGGATAPSATVIIKVPQVQAQLEAAPQPAAAPRPRAQAPAPAEAPQPVRPLDVHVIPPPKPAPKGTSSAVWVLLTLFVVGALGGSYYWFVLRPKMQEANQPPGPSVTQPATQPSAAGAGQTTGETGQAEGTTTAPAGTENMTPESASGAKPETGKPEEAAAKPGSPTPRIPAASRFGQLVVTSSPQGAKITIDGKTDSSWVTPATIPELSAGAHMVVLSKDGYENASRSVTVEGGRTAQVNGQLSMPSGVVNIITDPAGVEVFIDGKSYGPSPVETNLGVGEHACLVKWAGADPGRKTLTLENGAYKTLRFKLGSGTVTPTGILEVRTIPPGATIFADGNQVSATTPTTFRLSAGTHTLTISLSGFVPIRKEVEVHANESVPVNERLSRQ